MLVIAKSRVRSRQSQAMVLTLFILLGCGALPSFILRLRSYSSSQTRTSSIGMIYTNVKDVAAHDFDAILILGGGVPSSVSEPPIYVRQRCDDAAAIRGDLEIPILTLSAGTAHMPQLLSTDGLPVWESTSSAAYLKKKHHIESNVYLETTAYDTIGNAFFARTSHTDVVKWRKLLVITNQVGTHVSSSSASSSFIF